MQLELASRFHAPQFTDVNRPQVDQMLAAGALPKELQAEAPTGL